MNAHREASKPRRIPDYARWSACFAVALGFHAAGAAALLARWTDEADLVASAPVIMIDLAPAPVAPEIVPTELPPDVVQSAEAEPEPEPEKPPEKIEIPPDPAPEPQLAMLPPPKPEPPKETKKPPQKKKSVARAAATADQRAERAAAPMPGAASTDSNAVPNWKSQLVAQLERHKRYPSEAQGAQGVTQLAFSIDRRGGVHNARIVRSSGSNTLDQATLSLVQRAAPLPPPPPEVSGSQIAIVVPIRYHAR